MAQPATRADFISWCLRKLGSPVLDINVDPTQIDDRVDESLSYYWDYHFDGAEKMYFKHQITAADVSTSSITIPENIIGVVNIFPLANSIAMGTGIFNVQDQFVMNNIQDFTSYNILGYWQAMEYLQFMEKQLVGMQHIRYNRHVNQLYIDASKDRLVEGQYIIAECYQIVDPNIYASVWSDRWLQNYTTAKIKYQWGTNLTKFSELQLPGGVKFNGEKILNDAALEIEALEKRMMEDYSLPVTDLYG
jgi:hypothetical protein